MTVKYGHLDLVVEYGSIQKTFLNSQVVRHYPFTDRSVRHSLGKGATRISMIILFDGNKERLLSLLHGGVERDLVVGHEVYRNVVVDDYFNVQPFGRSIDGLYKYFVPFVALDPTPYDAETGGILY